MNSIISTNIQELKSTLSNQKVSKCFLIGSALGQEFNNQSDIDLLVSFDDMDVLDFADNYFLLQEKLEQLFNRKVDLVIEKDLKNPVFIREILQTRQLIYENPNQKMVA